VRPLNGKTRPVPQPPHVEENCPGAKHFQLFHPAKSQSARRLPPGLLNLIRMKITADTVTLEPHLPPRTSSAVERVGTMAIQLLAVPAQLSIPPPNPPSNGVVPPELVPQQEIVTVVHGIILIQTLTTRKTRKTQHGTPVLLHHETATGTKLEVVTDTA